LGVSQTQIEVFLELLALAKPVRASAQAVGINVRTFYELRRREPWFAEAWEDAREHAVGDIEEALRESAIKAPLDSMARVRAGEVLLKRFVPGFGQPRVPLPQQATATIDAGDGRQLRVSVGTPIPD
jgi:hypothetical protein